MPRKQYDLDLKLTLTLDDESLQSVTEILEEEVYEFCHRLEHDRDVRVDLLHFCDVTEHE